MAGPRYKTTRSNRDLGRLYTVLDKALPKLRNKDGALDVRELAGMAGVSHTYLYNAFKKEEINSETAKALAKICGHAEPDAFMLFVNHV